jgi:hypothetical protein
VSVVTNSLRLRTAGGRSEVGGGSVPRPTPTSHPPPPTLSGGAR